MGLNNKRILFLALAVVFALAIIMPVYPAVAQKITPPPPKITPPDSLPNKQSLPEKSLPSLDLKEYTILGRDRLRVLPSQRQAIGLADITTREMIAAAENDRQYQPPGAGGEKSEQSFQTNFGGVINEAYVAFGRYTDINAGLKLRKQYPKDVYFANFDYHINEGHITNADFYDVSADVSQIHRYNDSIQNTTSLSFNLHDYKFYSVPFSPIERKRYHAEISTATSFTNWDPLNIRWEVGGRYLDPDDSKIFNWDLWTRFDWNSIAYSTLLSGLFEFNTDRIKDGSLNNAPLSDANYGKALFQIERLITKRLHLKVGGAFYYYYSQNAINEFSIENNELVVSDERILKTREDNIVVPIGAITFDMAEGGRLFVEYEPTVASFNLLDKIRYNPYLDLTSPHTYEHTSHDFRVGWRRSYAYDLAFEIFYSDKRIKNYGILLDKQPGLNIQDGSFIFFHDNILDINEYRGIINWNPHPRFNAWSSLSYIDYTISKSDIAERVPYLPNFTFDFSLQYLPGYGVKFILDGQYSGTRFVSPVAGNRNKLDEYLLANLTISKQWSWSVGSYVYFSNLFNQKYELWNRYLEPDLKGGAGFRYFW